MQLRPIAVFLVFVAIFFALDRTLAFGLSRIYTRLETGAQAGASNYALKQTDAEVVVFGSSRAVYHVDPEILSEGLGLNAFNAGLPGQGIQYARGIEALLLRRGSQARLFVLHVNPENLWDSDTARIARLAPYYGEDPALDALLNATSPSARFKYAIRTFRYNSLVFPMLGSLLRGGEEIGNGFRSMPPDRPQDLRPHDAGGGVDPGPIDPAMSDVYADFIDAARARGIEVVLVDGPRWRPQGMDAMTKIGHAHLRELAARHGAAFIAIDEFTNPVFLDPDYFADVAHLNHAGATLYSEFLVEKLKVIVDRRG